MLSASRGLKSRFFTLVHCVPATRKRLTIRVFGFFIPVPSRTPKGLIFVFFPPEGAYPRGVRPKAAYLRRAALHGPARSVKTN
eukprot:4367738-Prymnesium_polylepis.1